MDGQLTVALAGDTMLGRGVAAALASSSRPVFGADVVATVRQADVAVLNLECCISTRGEPWPDPAKRFFFRAPPAAADALADLGASCVTLANNHALDFGGEALLDTLEHLAEAGIEAVGAGPDLDRARRPVVLEADGFGVVGVTDHPAEYAATSATPGVAFAALDRGVPEWLLEEVSGLQADARRLCLLETGAAASHVEHDVGAPAALVLRHLEAVERDRLDEMRRLPAPPLDRCSEGAVIEGEGGHVRGNEALHLCEDDELG